MKDEQINEMKTDETKLYYSAQRLKLLYLAKFLFENSNEEHPVSINDMINYLDECNISAERKALYKDIEALQDFGFDIIRIGKRGARYYIGKREFDLAELKLLADVIESSNFITENKSKELINKIEKLTNIHDAKGLSHEVMVSDRAKTSNETIFYIVDGIWRAIDTNKTVKFKYCHYDMYKEKKADDDGKYKEASPFVLMYEMKNYYMLAYDHERKKLWHFRIDRMIDVNVTDSPRIKTDQYTKADFSGYVKGVFNMYNGEETEVTLEMPNGYANVVIDRFGIDTIIIPNKETDRFQITVPIKVSKQFYGWVFGLGKDVEIVAPKSVREEFKKICQDVIEANTDRK